MASSQSRYIALKLGFAQALILKSKLDNVQLGVGKSRHCSVSLDYDV